MWIKQVRNGVKILFLANPQVMLLHLNQGLHFVLQGVRPLWKCLLIINTICILILSKPCTHWINLYWSWFTIFLCAVGFCLCCVFVFSHVWIFMTLWTIDFQAPLSIGFFRQENWNELPFPTPGDLPDSGIKPSFLVSLSLAGRFFTTEPPVKGLILSN